MDSQKKKLLLEETYERIINVGLCILPYEDLSDLAAPELMLFGTTKDEKVFSFSELDAMFKSQYEQMDGFMPSLDRKRLFTRISDDGNNAFITEEVTLTISSPEEVNSIFIRASCVMEYIDNRWKLTHWHASTPVETENDHWHIEEWKREKEKLQQLVDEQTADLHAKNRELEIEAAIERVRAVAMGMSKPDEMLKVCRVISEQLEQFGVEHIRNVQTVIINEEKGTYHNYQYFTPYDKESIEISKCDETPVVYEMVTRMLESADAFFTTKLTGEKLATFREYRKQENQFPDPLLDETESIDGHFFSIGPGGLGITLYRPLNTEGLNIFKRFHNVFSLAYRRFRDIEKAEAQTREAKIELSLERIRAQVTAMQESSDLLDIVVTMRTEFVNLGHEAHYFWHMRWLPELYEKAMTSGDGSRIGMVMTLPRHIHGDIQPVAEWEKGDEPIFVLAMDVDTAVDYVDKMISLGDFEQVDPQAPTLDDIRHIGGLTFIMARTTHGEIGYSLPGVVPDPPKDAVDTLVRFAGVFDLAYRRFEDLKASERQAFLIREERDRLEIALNELHATQDQLVQQEKLASLGQLTAGIAHEIKNPLNFVNNFSDLSMELVEEVREEVRRMTEDGGPENSPLEGSAEAERGRGVLSPFEGGKNDEVVQGDDAELANASNTDLILEILNDIEANLKTIHKHGSRADSIVKSMLEHSRGGSGKMEPTDINALVKEFTNLCFHGMRASIDPINVDIIYDLDLNLGDVPLVAEDFSRVVLNLVNNAFDAMREKMTGDGGPKTVKKSLRQPAEGSDPESFRGNQGDDSSHGYNPKLTVRTKSDSGKVTIEIEDNGPGIPEEMKHKILQPFFTTKKGTQGTGLGLSITNDIVKAHGGTMSVFSEPGKTVFLIELKG